MTQNSSLPSENYSKNFDWMQFSNVEQPSTNPTMVAKIDENSVFKVVWNAQGISSPSYLLSRPLALYRTKSSRDIV
jgi:hypothetical protein